MTQRTSTDQKKPSGFPLSLCPWCKAAITKAQADKHSGCCSHSCKQKTAQVAARAEKLKEKQDAR